MNHFMVIVATQVLDNWGKSKSGNVWWQSNYHASQKSVKKLPIGNELLETLEA
jgi:hypothetical protein